MWLQRSRIMWLKEGDRNTKYFQSKAVWQARKNKIRELTGSIGVVHTNLDEMVTLKMSIFKAFLLLIQQLTQPWFLSCLRLRFPTKILRSCVLLLVIRRFRMRYFRLAP